MIHDSRSRGLTRPRPKLAATKMMVMMVMLCASMAVYAAIFPLFQGLILLVRASVLAFIRSRPSLPDDGSAVLENHISA